MHLDGRCALIAGAGIGGLAAGIALERAGWIVRVWERAANARELGFGVLLAPNAMAALRELGLAEAITSRGVEAKGMEVRRLDGRLLRRFAAPFGGAIVALRQELHGALLHALGPADLMFNRAIVGFEEHDNRVTVRSADGHRETVDLLIGADGVGSVVRRLLHPSEAPAWPSGYAAIRGVTYDAGAHLGALTGVGYLDAGVEAATVRASSDAVYWYLSLLEADLPSESQSPQQLVAARLHQFERPLRAILAAAHPDDMRFDRLWRRHPLSTWGTGHVTLVGDAAHPVLPHTGQGAAQALEDAVALGLALRRDGGLAQALRQYEQARIRRTGRLVRLGPRLAQLTTTRNPIVTALRTALIRIVPERAMSLSAQRFARDPHGGLR